MTTNEEFPESQRNRAMSRAASAAKAGVDAAGAGAKRVLDAVSGKLDDARNNAAPTLKRGIDQAKDWADEKAGRVQHGVQAARDKVNDLTGQVVDYTRDEPVKALLIAVAVGVGLIGLFSLIARSDD